MSTQESKKLEAVLEAATSYGDKFQNDVSDINLSASFNGRLGSGSVEYQKLDAAKNRYYEACIFVVGQFPDLRALGCDLRAALIRLEAQFHPRPNSMDRYRHEFSVDFGEALARVRDQICHQVEHGILKMGSESRNTTIIQNGANSVAVATGDNSPVSLTVNYSKIAQLAGEALEELQGWNVPTEKRNAIEDGYIAIGDEAKKATPDKSRMKRIAQRIADDIRAMKDAAISAGASEIGTAAATALLTAISSM
ncbi:hypothetical protein FE840_009160 [Peteryoungia desertarenae]|uniref:Uncharacterized protein n=1 Tax=Peteryoungia desertarenae TaxID=1813451 RepID=A0ABX6QM87_9HYPH|nr:hypothetical protein [Peteryoungia desertarenae]QLF69696.1 hypothetical protein FE840_009160 [Peteryoungia desertarenae]